MCIWWSALPGSVMNVTWPKWTNCHKNTSRSREPKNLSSSQTNRKRELFFLFIEAKFCLNNCWSRQNWGLSVWAAERDQALVACQRFYLYWFIYFMCLTYCFLLIIYALNFHAGHCRLMTFLFSMKESLARFSRIFLSKLWTASHYWSRRWHFLQVSE